MKRLLLVLALLLGAIPAPAITPGQKVVLLSSAPRPALLLNFTSGVLDPRITFTRASIGTDFDSTGVIVQFSSGTPRFGYDPVSHAPLGLLIEEGRTNLLLNSLLDGTNLSTQTVTVASGTTYALSFYGTGSIVNAGANSATLSGTGAFPSRAVLVFTASTTSLTLTVSGTVQYAQLEAVSTNYPGPTSFIPTAGAPVARAADAVSMTGSNFSSWYNQSAGTFVTQATPPGNYNQFVVVLSADSSASAYHTIGRGNSVFTAAGKRWAGQTYSGSAQATIVEGADSPSTTSKLAYAYAVNNFAFAANGLLVGTDTSGSLPSPTELTIGEFRGTSGWFGHVASIKYYRQRLSIANLQALTR